MSVYSEVSPIEANEVASIGLEWQLYNVILPRHIEFNGPNIWVNLYMVVEII